MFQEVLFLTYDIIRHVSVKRIQEEYGFSSTMVCDWGHFIRETMLVYMQDCSERIGGPNKTDEIDESRFGKHKFYRGHHGKGQ
jgi:hypothetical protein